ncbi:MAG: arylamine N-acetyltransferase [Acidobacteriota bacterium]
MPEPWTESYLSRIGYDGSREPSLETLRALQERHLLTVPFENLDIHWKRPIVVDGKRFLEKVVRQRRGGFCYELNGAFALLLRSLGFSVTMLSARVHSAAGGFGPPFDHMALLIRFGEQSRWLTDVGFGESHLQPLNLDARLEQHDPAGVFRIVPGEEFQMQSRHDGEWVPQFAFTLAPHELSEYAPMCDVQQFSPESHFTKGRVCTIATESGRVTLAETRLIITRDGERTEIPVAAEEWDEVLLETFVIRAPRA